jgi:hypothetical protein
MRRLRTVSSEHLPAAPDRLPTLTEVVELGLDEGGAALAPVAPTAGATEIDMLVARVCAEIQPHINLLFEARLREALAPVLARATDGLIHEARQATAQALRELVEDATARVLQSQTRN